MGKERPCKADQVGRKFGLEDVGEILSHLHPLHVYQCGNIFLSVKNMNPLVLSSIKIMELQSWETTKKKMKTEWKFTKVNSCKSLLISRKKE